ncbi:hypothetical protein [Arenimonas composti]|uniref:FecR protein domain-containing protein n=1 Tax=Arenimonas composti TR7-09 = DSM 18010 TaxID=1121013 RepID=A0A091BFC3_9GAMM|nr:hypothetical protein [Arenimonas composti]KFN51403.1 hypothetical protein P873_02750 [Arenimonas composti TR7-09 = DSM 18010]
MKRRLLALALSLSAASVAFAAEPVATLSAQDGVVMVNAGDEFVTAADGQALQPGERVLVMEGGTAQLTFADGCPLVVEAGSMVVVPEMSPCAGAVAAVQPVPRQYAQAVGSAGGSAGATGLVVAGVMGVTILLISEKDAEFDVPVSP